MITARATADAVVADFDVADPEAPIVYAEVYGGGDAAGPQKKGSRWNALRHGCMAKVLLPADLAAEAERCIGVLTAEYRPTTDYEVGKIKTMGLLAAQMERLQTMMVIDRQRTMDRAVVCWDDDRDIYIDKLAEGLATNPVGVSRALGRSKQGVAWLLKMWDALIDAHDTNGSWDQDQCHMAMNLLGYPVEVRNGSRAITPETAADVVDQVVTTELNRLDERLKRSLFATDSAEQALAAVGMPMEEDAQAKRLRKDEGRLRLAYRRAKAELLESRDRAAAAAAGPAPASASAPAAAVASKVRKDPDAEPGPRPRPKTSTAAGNFALKKSMLEGFEIPATATTPAQVVKVQLPFPGGDASTESEVELECDDEHECEPESKAQCEAEPVCVAEHISVLPQRACVAAHASAASAVNKRRERERHQRRALEKKARKAARRRGR